MDARRLLISGVVQGVGFRPYIYALAERKGLHGWVRNTSHGVEIAIEGEGEAVHAFLQALRRESPPLARIDKVEVQPATPNGYTAFTIEDSLPQPGGFQPIPADVALCTDCERELFDPEDRRYLYPFINCTNCGPRFTIILDLPYDRPATTMATFVPCPRCASEYADPRDRRFHAQPIACPACGPRVWLTAARGRELGLEGTEAVLEARRLLGEGAILAVRGLGGFHLACDAANTRSVEELRRRKGRVDKPFAVMAATLRTAESLCDLTEADRELLTGREKPIVLLPRSPGGGVSESVAPGLDRLGVMLPYTPLHHLLLDRRDARLAARPAPHVLVMTSGNYSEEPIAASNEEALEKLSTLADFFLLHDREIQQRCDDSVVVGRSFGAQGREASPQRAPVFLRRARGYAPYPVPLPFEAPPLLGLGGELKNTFCLARGRSAFLSQHIGDMENVETLLSFEHALELLTRLFRVKPELVIHDLHPDYLTTRWAREHAQPHQRLLAVQHHHAHIASCMADNGLGPDEKVIGVAFDGTGYGTDGAIWGGEFLLAGYAGFRRAGHLEYLPLPGGDAAIRHPWRVAVGYATALGLDLAGARSLGDLDPPSLGTVRRLAERRVNAPLTSSMGRLFDAVAAIAGGAGEASYEAQAAIEMEAAARRNLSDTASYPVELARVDGACLVRLGPVLAAVVADVRRGESLGTVGMRFHRTVANMVTEVCRGLREAHGLERVALSGGVWQNMLVLSLAERSLRESGFQVLFHRQVPPNDGGLSLGQAAVGARARLG